MNIIFNPFIDCKPVKNLRTGVAGMNLDALTINTSHMSDSCGSERSDDGVPTSDAFLASRHVARRVSASVSVSVCVAWVGYGQNPPWTKSPPDKIPLLNRTPRTKSPYDRALMSTTGYCIAYEKLRILSFYRELKH